MYGVCMFLHSFFFVLFFSCVSDVISHSLSLTPHSHPRDTIFVCYSFVFRLLFWQYFFSTVNAIKIIRKFVYRLWKHDRCTITPKKMHNFVCTFLLLFKVSVSFVYFFLSSETRRFCFFQNLSIECHTHTHSHIQTNRFSLFFLNSRQ